MNEAQRLQNQKEVLAGITAQADFSLKYVTDIVNSNVTDRTQADLVIAQATAKLNLQRDNFSKAVRDEFNEADDGSELTVDLV